MVCIVHSGTGRSCLCTWSLLMSCVLSPWCLLSVHSIYARPWFPWRLHTINNDVADVDVTLMKKPCKVLYRSCLNCGEIYSKTLFFSDCITIVFLGRGGVMEMYIWINKHIEYILPVESSLAAVSLSALRQNQPPHVFTGFSLANDTSLHDRNLLSYTCHLPINRSGHWARPLH